MLPQIHPGLPHSTAKPPRGVERKTEILFDFPSPFLCRIGAMLSRTISFEILFPLTTTSGWLVTTRGAFSGLQGWTCKRIR
jgi:hypothetical protein